MTGHDGGQPVYYQGGKQYGQNYGLRAYEGRGTGDKNWYNKGLRSAQGWFYDDGVNNAGFYLCMGDNDYYNETLDQAMLSNKEHNAWDMSAYPVGAFNNASF